MIEIIDLITRLRNRSQLANTIIFYDLSGFERHLWWYLSLCASRNAVYLGLIFVHPLVLFSLSLPAVLLSGIRKTSVPPRLTVLTLM